MPDWVLGWPTPLACRNIYLCSKFDSTRLIFVHLVYLTRVSNFSLIRRYVGVTTACIGCLFWVLVCVVCMTLSSLQSAPNNWLLGMSICRLSTARMPCVLDVLQLVNFHHIDEGNPTSWRELAIAVCDRAGISV